MKKLFIPLLIICFIIGGRALGQWDTASHKCPIGYMWVPTREWDYNFFIADSCYEDSVANRIMINVSKSICHLENGFGMWSGDLNGNGSGYYEKTEWVNDSIGCKSETIYEITKNRKKYKVSKCEFFYKNGTQCSTYNTKTGKSINIPCCGHIHTKPEKSWIIK